MDILKLTWKMEGAVDGEDADPTNPLSMAVGKLFREGQPFLRLMQCFCADQRRGPATPILRWFGVFVLSAGGRIVFFPGFQSPRQHVSGFRETAQMWKEEFDFDHISLERDHRRWHITSRGSKRHLGGPTTSDLGNNQFLWLGLSVASLDELRLVKSETKVVTEVAPSDTKRRIEVFSKAREGARFQILQWEKEVWQAGAGGFWHFGLIVGPSSSPSYMGSNLGFPIGSPFLAAPIQFGTGPMPVRHHTLDLSAETTLQIVTAYVPGVLKEGVVLTAPSDAPVPKIDNE